MEIKSRVGEGTLVKVFLPRADMLPSDRELEDVDQGSKPEEARLTILVVEDDRTVLRSTVRMLDSLGYRAVPAASGREALRLLESEPKVDLVLADFAMPEMTGVELADAIRTRRPGLPVIVVTGYGNREALQHFSEARILQKPCSEGDLMQRIAAALN